MTLASRFVVVAVAASTAIATPGCGTDAGRAEPSTPATTGALAIDPPPATASSRSADQASVAAAPTGAASAAPEPAVPERATIELGPWQGELTPLVAQHVARAKSEGRVPFVEFYADWCPPCKALKRYWNEPSIAAAFRGTYIIVLNVDDWQDKLKGTGFVPRTIPVFYAVDDKGKPTGRQITGDDWGKNKDTPDRMAPALARFFAGP